MRDDASIFSMGTSCMNYYVGMAVPYQLLESISGQIDSEALKVHLH